MEGELQGFGVCFVCIDGSYNKKVVHQDKTFISVTSTLAWSYITSTQSSCVLAVCVIIINVISLLLFVVESEAQGGCSAVPCGPEHRGGDVQQRGGVTRLLCLPGAAGRAGAAQRIHQIRCTARHKEWVFTRASIRRALCSINVFAVLHKSQDRNITRSDQVTFLFGLSTTRHFQINVKRLKQIKHLLLLNIWILYFTKIKADWMLCHILLVHCQT